MKMDKEFLEYSALDSACTLEIWEGIKDELNAGYRPAYQMTLAILPVLMFMQTRGLKVNHTLLDEAKTDVLRSKAEKQDELNRLCGRELNVNSPKDCQNYFYIEKGIPPYRNGDSITTDDMAMQRIARGTAKHRGLREAKLVQEIRGLGKLYGTYLNIEFDADDRMRCSFNPRGTKFGRLSSSQTVFGTGTNMQNLPQEFKKFLVPDDGYVFVEIDKRQAEWVATAYCAGDANMIQAIEDGVDVHVHTASLMFNVEPELVQYENKLIGHESSADRIAELRMSDDIVRRFMHNMPRTMSMRQCGKKSNHGLNYDEGYRGFALINEIEERDAKVIVDLYHRIYPGIRIWYDTIKRLLQKDRTLTNYFGRRVRFMGQWNDQMWKSAYSMLPQSTVVDALNGGMVKIYEDNWITGKDHLNVDILAQVHDSILMQVPIGVVKNPLIFAQFRDRIYEYVSPPITYNGRTFSIATDMKIGMNWGGENKKHNPLGMVELNNIEDLPKILEQWESLSVPGTVGLA